ncbi:MAG: trypsin-like serine peptidase [Panacagrimonas sp.]
MSRIRPFVLLGLLGLLHAQGAQALSSRALDAVPLHVVPAQAAAQAREQISADTSGHAPLRLSVGVPVDLSLADGSWSNDDATGIATWRARVYSGGATLLIPAFDRFDLPEGAELWVSDVAGSIVNGPYTRREHGSGTLQTAMVPGEEMLIEVRVPVAQRDAVDLHLAGVGHGVHDFASSEVAAKSGSCNIDVACSEGNGWRDQIRSVVRLQIPTGALGGAVLCSGLLVNNTAGLGNRYFLLTANHCGATASTASGVSAYFNFQVAQCGSTPTQNPMGFPKQTGTRFIANHSRGDHTLLEFTAAPSSSLNVFYSGFDAGPTSTVSSGASIHHPAGHEKRISLFSGSSRVSGQSVGSFVVDAFRVDWNAGVTEQGSSGAGLWNQSGQVVGVLSGGASSCTNPNGYDYFGRLDVAWQNLAAHLDTAGIGARSVGGRNANGVPPSSTGGGSGTGSGDSSSGGGGGGGSFGVLATLTMLLAGLLRGAAPRLTSRRASRGAGAA